MLSALQNLHEQQQQRAEPELINELSTSADIRSYTFTSQDPHLTLAASRGQVDFVHRLTQDKTDRPRNGASPTAGKSFPLHFYLECLPVNTAIPIENLVLTKLQKKTFGLIHVTHVVALEAGLLCFNEQGNQVAVVLVNSFSGRHDIPLGAASNCSLALRLAINANLDLALIKRIAAEPGVDPNAHLFNGFNSVLTSLKAQRFEVFEYLVSPEGRGIPTDACVLFAAVENDHSFLNQVLACIPSNVLDDPLKRIMVFLLIVWNNPLMLQTILQAKPAWAPAIVEHQDAFINVFEIVIGGVLANLDTRGDVAVSETVRSILAHRDTSQHADHLTDNATYQLAVNNGLIDLAATIRNQDRIQDPKATLMSILDGLPTTVATQENYNALVEQLDFEGQLNSEEVRELIGIGRNTALISLYQANKVTVTRKVLFSAALNPDDDPAFVSVLSEEYQAMDQADRDSLSYKLGVNAKPAVLGTLLKIDGLINIAKVFDGLFAQSTSSPPSNEKTNSVLDIIVPRLDFPAVPEAITRALYKNAYLVLANVQQHRIGEFNNHFTCMSRTQRRDFVLGCFADKERSKLLAIVHRSNKIATKFVNFLPPYFETACIQDNADLVSFVLGTQEIRSRFDVYENDNQFFKIAFNHRSVRVCMCFLELVDPADRDKLSSTVIVNEHLEKVITWRDEPLALLFAPFASREQHSEAVAIAVEFGMKTLVRQLVQQQMANTLVNKSRAFRRAVDLGEHELIEFLAPPFSDPNALGSYALFKSVEKKDLITFKIVVTMPGIDLFARDCTVLVEIARIPDQQLANQFLSALMRSKAFVVTLGKLGVFKEIYDAGRMPEWMLERLETECGSLWIDLSWYP